MSDHSTLNPYTDPACGKVISFRSYLEKMLGYVKLVVSDTEKTADEKTLLRLKPAFGHIETQIYEAIDMAEEKYGPLASVILDPDDEDKALAIVSDADLQRMYEEANHEE